MGAYLAHWRIQVAKIVIKQAYDTIPPPAGLDPLITACDAMHTMNLFSHETSPRIVTGFGRLLNGEDVVSRNG